jgi:hypothetical protein
VRGTWTITEGKQAAPTPRKQKYVGSSELSPEFVDEHGPLEFVKAKVVDSEQRVAHVSPVGKHGFVPLHLCLEKLGVRKCTKCDDIKPLHDYNRQGTGSQLRGECKACQTVECSERRTAVRGQAVERATAGETRLCAGPCGQVKSVACFSENRAKCNCGVNQSEGSQHKREQEPFSR